MVTSQSVNDGEYGWSVENKESAGLRLMAAGIGGYTATLCLSKKWTTSRFESKRIIHVGCFRSHG